VKNVQPEGFLQRRSNRRSFLKDGAIAAGAASMGAALLSGRPWAALAESEHGGPPITKGDIAILRFLSAIEQVETDLWQQYSELGGTQDNEISGVNGGNSVYTAALQILDGDMPQYIHDNTDDEISHHRFLNNYLASKGARGVDLRHFATLPSSTAEGAHQRGRLTNLTQLTIDTTFWSRYRSITNPDFDPGATFVPAVPSLAEGRHTAIPRSNDDTAGSSLSADNTKSITTHLQAIAFTAGFHFAFIEQGGSSLYPTLALKVTNLEVLRILLSIDTDNGPGGTGASVTFATLSEAQGETTPESLKGDTLQANLIMPEPCHFIDKKLGPVSIIRPIGEAFSGAVNAVKSLQADGLFMDQSPRFIELLLELAAEADDAKREL